LSAVINADNKSASVLSPDDLRLAQPILTLREAAGHLAMPVSTLHTWASGRSASPLVATVAGSPGGASVPFVGFAEAFVLSAFRRAGVPMQRIRPAVEVLRDELGLEHALASKELYTDGAEVLYRFAEREEPGLLELTVVRTGQKQFSEIVSDYLQRITYGDDGWVRMIELPAYRRATVVVDPARAFGLPLVAHGGARVEDLVDRFVAGDSLSEVAADFGVPLDEVEDVIRVATQASPAAA
jgi:uncharacterized protein (DUF433 family)